MAKNVIVYTIKGKRVGGGLVSWKPRRGDTVCGHDLWQMDKPENHYITKVVTLGDAWFSCEIVPCEGG